uniref:Uncharacterized protein n=1 Tax=Arundo donax TaxID=35708 RepID=A0A0A8YHA7_ARUDO
MLEQGHINYICQKLEGRMLWAGIAMTSDFSGKENTT